MNVELNNNLWAVAYLEESCFEKCGRLKQHFIIKIFFQINLLKFVPMKVGNAMLTTTTALRVKVIFNIYLENKDNL